ncbi:class I SAM-dependent methyltransferase [Pseudomarimonas salicorniae]|uniref:Class I SAM-dependent methyltransferase n=1 Tax=Pseudomarimonas salicorniae TaxID=2933270 RepID=A0ABT0GIV2_9GAMM|nr:class I SAM-dependent methyltransferase [Lysobacter sp. CAU 1642]MCK7594471.1 class I SAM-dependent methyltransferase [Lysobacter sp. CAU 1642]
MNARFEEIYERNEWGHGSGEGSLPVHTRSYVRFLERFLRAHRVRSVVDMGCGDWQFSRGIDWGSAEYRGYDVVPSVIASNEEQFSAPNVSFHLYSGNPQDLPSADLLLVKDVLQHLPHDAIHRFLPCVQKYQHALITNCVNPRGITENVDIPLGAFRYLDLRRPPFGIDAKQVFSFKKNTGLLSQFARRPEWKKVVLHIQGTCLRPPQR